MDIVRMMMMTLFLKILPLQNFQLPWRQAQLPQSRANGMVCPSIPDIFDGDDDLIFENFATSKLSSQNPSEKN